jgi:predicted ABC-type ATPase
LYINTDRFERELKENLRFNFNAYRVKVSQIDFLNHVKSSTLYLEKIKSPDFIDQIEINSGILKLDLPKNQINSYHASFVASYLVDKLLETKQSFCFETVMSHESKVDLLGFAKSQGYKTYLYFVYTDDPELNVTRVKLKALMGLHDVNPDIIRSHYKRSFELLPKAIKIADQAFIVNNSDTLKIVAEADKGILTIKSSLSTNLKDVLNYMENFKA